MNVFAGFWVDGAVRKPDERHFDRENLVIACWKDELSFDLLLKGFSDWHGVYWLDTTPRESLTPEELLAVVKIVRRKCLRVIKPSDGATVEWQVDFDDTNAQTHITWGDLMQYPPPAEPQWIRITRENVGQYLFRECRFRDSDSQDWRNGHVSGWDKQDACCLVYSDFEEDMPIMQWNIVEVQNDPTP